MHLRSLYPELPPLPPSLNAYLVLAERPEQDEWPDFVAHVEVVTGKTRTFHELRRRINDIATVLAAPITLGGLELRPGGREIIGIISDNSSVSDGLNTCLLESRVTKNWRAGLRLSHNLMLKDRCPLRPYLLLLDLF